MTIPVTIGNTRFNLNPESLVKVRTHCEKKPKASNPKAVKRVFPKDDTSLKCTDNYVRNYLLINNLNYRYERDTIKTGYVLNTAPTTWPEGEECIYSEEVTA